MRTTEQRLTRRSDAAPRSATLLILAALHEIFLLIFTSQMIDTTASAAPMPRSSFRLWTHAAKQTFPMAIAIFRKTWLTLLVLQAVHGGAGQFFTYAMDTIRSTGREDLFLIATVASVELVFTLLWSAIWVLVICSAALIDGNGTPPASRFNQLMIEQVRSLAAVIWRMPLLFVPALVKYVRLTFVPFVVLLDAAYDRGEIDALQASDRLSKGHFWLLGGTLLFSGILPWIAEELAQGGDGPLFSNNPFGVTMGWLMTLAINLLTSVFLLELFRGFFAIREETGPKA